MRERLLNARSAKWRFGSVVEPGPELFVAGVLAVALVLAAVKVTLPPQAVPILGGLAFCVMLATGALRLTGAQSLRGVSPEALSGFFAVVWIAAGMFTDHALVASWLN